MAIGGYQAADPRGVSLRLENHTRGFWSSKAIPEGLWSRLDPPSVHEFPLRVRRVVVVVLVAEIQTDRGPSGRRDRIPQDQSP